MTESTGISASPAREQARFRRVYRDHHFPSIGRWGVNIGFSRPHIGGIRITVETRPMSLADKSGVCASTSFIYNNAMQRDVAFEGALKEFARRQSALPDGVAATSYALAVQQRPSLGIGPDQGGKSGLRMNEAALADAKAHGIEIMEE